MPEWVLTKDKERIKREEGRTIGAVKELQNLLGLTGLNRMERMIFPIQMDLNQLALWLSMKKENRREMTTVNSRLKG